MSRRSLEQLVGDVEVSDQFSEVSDQFSGVLPLSIVDGALYLCDGPSVSLEFGEFATTGFWSSPFTSCHAERTGRPTAVGPSGGTLARMDTPHGLLEVGHVGRAHGIRGDVFLVLTTDRVERAAVGSRLWVRNRWIVVTQSSNASGKWRVHLEGVDDRTAAEALAGTPVLAEPIEDPDALWVHHLIGATVIEENGIDRGRCTSVVANPAADLLELDSGALVPVTFVTAVDVSGGVPIVTIEPPDGLFDLDD